MLNWAIFDENQRFGRNGSFLHGFCMHFDRANWVKDTAGMRFCTRQISCFYTLKTHVLGNALVIFWTKIVPPPLDTGKPFWAKDTRKACFCIVFCAFSGAGETPTSPSIVRHESNINSGFRGPEKGRVFPMQEGQWTSSGSGQEGGWPCRPVI